MPKKLAWLTKRTPNIIHTMKMQKLHSPIQKFLNENAFKFK